MHAVWLPPPLVYLGGLVLGVVLQAFFTPLDISISLSFRAGLTALAALCGAAFLSGAIHLFRKSDQNPKPWRDTPEILSAGVYQISRNPMYLGMALIQIAIGIGLANGWIIVLVLPVLLIVYVTAIRHEETYLEEKFGSVYTDYKASVRRWL